MAFGDSVSGKLPAALPHCLYELKKGVRCLCLLTMSREEASAALLRIKRERIAVCVQQVTPTKVNVYFGKRCFVNVAQKLAKRPLNDLTPAEDFVLGTLLGYAPAEQCRRYLKKTEEPVQTPAAHIQAIA